MPEEGEYYQLFSELITKLPGRTLDTGCSLNIVFFPKTLRYSGLWPFSIFPRCQCVYTHQTGRKPALQQNWQSSEKSQNFKDKKTIFNEHPVLDKKKNYI